MNASESLLNYTDDLLALLDLDLRFLAVNDSYRHLFGKPREYFIAHTMAEVFVHDPAHYQEVVQPSLECCLQGKSVKFEHWVEVPDFGNLFLEIEYKPARNPQGGINGVAIVGRNRTEVRRSIEALKNSETQLNRAAHIANLGGWFFNVHTKEFQWTEGMYDIHEVSKDFQLTGENIAAFIPAEQYSAVHEKLALNLGGERTEVIFNMITAKGNRKWVRSIAFPVFEKSEVVSVDGILQDITEITDMQLQLRRSEEKFRNLVEESNALVWEASVSPFRFTYMSPQAEQITGYSPADWCSHDFIHQHIHPDDNLQTLHAAGLHIQKRKDFILEYRIIKSDGSAVWLHDNVKIILDKQGIAEKLRGVMIDVTPMKEMQAGLNRALRALENYKYILDKHAIVATTDKNGNITYVNDKFVENTGYEREELLGYNQRLSKSGFHSPVFYKKMWETIISGQVWQGEICNRNKAGNLYWVYTTIVPILDENGRIEEFMSVRTDITELKRTEETLRRAQKMEAIGQLTGGIAHDFNNLLGIIIGNLELIEMTLPFKDAIHYQLDNAKNAAIRGSVLTRRLLNFSHQTPVLGKTLELNKVIKSLEVLISKSLTALVSVDMKLGENLWQVEADPGDFEDSIINLVINASDAMPKGGKLRFATRNYAATHMEFRSKGIIPPGQYVEILVEDTGIGMPVEVIEKIFDPYFSTKPSDKGSGLGLAMVYGFVKRSKGLIFVESSPGNGARFSIYLPKSQQDNNKIHEAEQLRAQVKVQALSNETILLVDDEVDILKITRTNLENLGYRVLCSNNGDAALKVIKSPEHIDLLFTDIVMPGALNGYELAEAALQYRPGLKVLFTTGYAKVENKVTREDWRNSLIQKP